MHDGVAALLGGGAVASKLKLLQLSLSSNLQADVLRDYYEGSTQVSDLRNTGWFDDTFPWSVPTIPANR